MPLEPDALYDPLSMPEHRDLAAELSDMQGQLLRLAAELAWPRDGRGDGPQALAYKAALAVSDLRLVLSDQMVHDHPERARLGIYFGDEPRPVPATKEEQ